MAETIQGGFDRDVPPSKIIESNSIEDKYELSYLDEVWCGTGTTGKPFLFRLGRYNRHSIFKLNTSCGYGEC